MKLPKTRTGAAAIGALAILLVSATLVRADFAHAFLQNLTGFPDPTGFISTYNQNGNIDLNGPFFQSLGTNGRSCGSCHQPSDAMSVAAAHVQTRFDQSQGLDPIFRTVDGSVCPSADVSTLQTRQSAYSLLLN